MMDHGGAFPSLSNYMVQTYGDVGKLQFRAYQKNEHKIATISTKQIFLRRCLQYGIVPNFARISRKRNKCFDRNIAYCEQKILKSALRQTYKDRHFLEQQQLLIGSDLHQRFSQADFHFSIEFVQKSAEKFQKNTATRLHQKFNSLRAKMVINRPNNAESRSHSEQKVKKIVHNLSNRSLTATEQSILEKGLGFALSQKHIPVLDFKVSCENFGRKLVIQNSNMSKLQRNEQSFPFRANTCYFPENEDMALKACLLDFGNRCQ